jgi:hypothetical protein
MTFDAINAMLGNVSRLLTQAEHSADAAERTAALKQLKAIQAALEKDLQEAEQDKTANANRRVEAAALRAAHTTLVNELRVIELTEKLRDQQSS